MEELTMNGRWIGNAAGGDGTGKLIVNVDESDSHYEGVAFIHDDDPSMPISVALIRTKDRSADFEFRAEIHPVHPESEQPVNWASLKEWYPDVDGFSSYADVKGCVSSDSLTVSWQTNLGIDGHAVLPRTQAGQPSPLKAEEKSWDHFKAYVATLQNRRQFLFRGQEELWKLRTSFHRTGRANVARFVAEDIPRFTSI